MQIDKELLNEAISRLSADITRVIKPVEYVWEQYNQLLKQKNEDKKMVNINLLMDVKGVEGVEWNHLMNLVVVNTYKGRKVYRTGRYTMNTIVKRVEKFLQTH